MKKWLKHEVSTEFTLALARLQWKMRRFFAILGIIAMLGSLLPNIQQTYANSLPGTTTNEVVSTPVEYPTTTEEDFDISNIALLGEVKSLRTESTKTFQRVDGSFVVAMYTDIVHYQKNGKWENIDNSLYYNTENDSFSNQKNQFTVKFPKSLDDNKSFKLSMGDYSISWSILGISKTNIEVADPAVKTNNMKELTGINQEVTYTNVMNGVDIQYALTGTKVKENIILDHFIQDFSLTFEYSVKNLSLIEKEGSYGFVDEEGDIVFDFSYLFAVDAEGETTDQVRLNISETKKDTYQVVLSLDNEWGKDATYPITIDPTISSSVQTVSIYDTYVSEVYDTTNYGRSTILILADTSSSSEYRGLLRFLIPSTVMSKQIIYATLQLSTSVKTNDRTLALYENLSSFIDYGTGGVTWQTMPDTSDEMIDYHITGSSTTYLFNITKSVQSWQSSGISSVPGFTICDKELYGGYNSVKSIEYTNDPALKPVIEIGYVDPAGLKDYWTYNSQQVGENSTGYISDLTGLLNVVRNDMSFSTDRQTLSLSFGYNILDRTTNYGYYNGWNIVYNTYVKEDTSLGLYYSQDFTGNKVYYHPTSCDSRFDTPPYPYTYSCYIAEDGSGNTLVKQTIYGSFVGYFIYTTDEFKQYFNTSGYLTSILDDKTNQTITITRDGTYPNRVTVIQDSAGNRIELAYSGSYLATSDLYVYQDSTHRNLVEEVNYSYHYKGDGTGEYVLEVEYSKNYDSSDNMTVDDSLFYDYDPYGRIMAHYLDGRDLVEYTYNTSSNKVTNVKSFYDDNPFSNIDYTYDFRETTITDQNDDFVIYKFDSFGHTVNILDSDGNVQFYEYLNLFSSQDTSGVDYLVIDGDPNYRINNSLVSQSSPQSNLFNPISNQGFEYDSSNLEVSWLYVDDHGELRELDKDEHCDDNALYGSYSAMINSGTIDYGHFEQTVILDEGAYTLTGYVWNQGSNNNVWIDVIGEDYGGAITYVANNNEWTKVTVTFGVYDDDTEITVSLVNHTYGRAYFDNIEIYEGFIDNRTNMIDNASFEMTGSIFPIPGWYFSNSTYVYRSNIESGLDEIYQSVLGDYAVRIDGSGTEARSAVTGISEFLDTSVLDEKGQLVIGAWALSDGTPTTIASDDYEDGNNRYLRVRVDFVSSVTYIYGETYPSTVIKSEYIDFDTSVEGWQYQYAKVAMPEENTYWINVFLEYKGEGTVYFDGLQIFYENAYTNYEYDEFGNLKAIQTSSGDRTEYSYDGNKDYASTPTDISLSDDTKLELSENSNDLIDEVTYNNVSSTPTYNTYGQVTSMQVGNDTTYFTTSTSYTHLSQYVSTKTDEFNNVTDYYNDTLTGLLEAIENAKGQDTHYIYDNEGKLVKVVSVDDYQNYSTGDEDALVEYMYDTADRLWKIVLDDDYYYEISYDDQGRIEQISVNTTPLMSYTYEMDGSFYTNRLSEQTYGNGDILKFTYNDKDQIETIQFKESSGSFVTKFSYEYDDFGHMAVYNTYDNGSVVATEFYTYDSSGHLIQAVDEEGNIIKYIYDDSGNLTSLYFEIDGQSSNTNYTYNECFLYDENDACIQTSSLYDNTEYDSASGFNVLKDYHYEDDALYRLEYINLTWSSLNIKQNFVYSGNTTRINQITYELNGAGVDYKYSYNYDSLGNITHEYYYEATTLKLYRNYEYDVLNQLVVEDSRDYNYTSATLSATNYTKYYYYDSHGNRTDVKTFLYGQNDIITPTAPSYYQSNSGLYDAYMLYNGNKTYQNMYYLNVGQTPSLSLSYYDEWDFDHEYPISGMTTTMTYNNLNTSVAGYYYRQYTATDGMYYTISFRIVFKVGTPLPYNTIPQAHLHYNYSTNWEDQLLNYGEIEYINGVPQTEVTLQQFTYDSQGNPTEITHFVYNGTTYDRAYLTWSGRELNTITVMQGYSTPLYKITYKYNNQGYRTQKAFYTYYGYTPVLTEKITYELIDDKVVYETNGTYGILFTYDYDGTLISFNYDANVNDQYAGSEYFYLRNQMGDISHIVDSFGNIVVHYVYDAYGNITYQTPNQTIGDINPYRYRGYRYDEELSWYYLNSRYYTPEVGRFINADGLLGQFGDILSTNMFAYCANNPVMYTDSDGEFAIFVFLIVTIVTTLAVHGAMKAYETAKDLGSEGWELAGYTASGIILGDYLPVKDNWDEISSTIIPNPDPNIDMIDFYFDLEGNSFYSCYTAGLYANYLKNTYYSNNSRRTELGMYIELQGHYIAYDLGLFPDHSNPVALGVPVWGSDPTAFIAESLAEILYGISNLSPIY